MSVYYKSWLPKSLKKSIKKELKEKKLNFKKYEIPPKDLCAVVKEILGKYTPNLFVESIRCMFNPITIVNAQGEELSINSLNFIIKDKDEVVKKLDNLKELERSEADELFWTFTEKRKCKKPIEGKSISSTDRIFLGDLEIKDNKLLCNTMTKSASDKLLRILQDTLGELVGMAVIEHENLFDGIKKSKKNKEKETYIPVEVQEEMLQEFYNEHLKKSLDQKIPFLNNKTPRQCAKADPKSVLRWIEMMEENANSQIPSSKYNIS